MIATQTVRVPVSAGIRCQADLRLAATENSEKVGEDHQIFKNKLLCIACMDSRILKGQTDLSLDIHIKAGSEDDTYFKDDRLSMMVTEVIGGLCGSGQDACDS